MKLFYAVAAALLIAACAKPDYYVMRHLHRAEGLDRLTEQGERNAKALHDFLKPTLPRAIYVTSALRAQKTAEDIAERLNLTPIIYDPADPAALAARVRAEPNKPVLIVGHSNTVPDIVRRLGGVEPRPIRDDEFGQIFLVYSDGATRIRRLAVP